MSKKKKIIYIIIVSFIIIGNLIWYFNFSNTARNKKDEKDKEQITNTYKKVDDTINYDNVVLKYQDMFSNKDIIGELSIINTDLKVPIVKGRDNNYYLKRLLNKQVNSLGSVFIDYRNNTTDRKIIMYGHNSHNVYTEFHILEKYLNSSYYSDHSIINFKDINYTYTYEIFSVYKTNKNYKHVNLNFTSDEYSEHVKWLKNNSLYDTHVSVDDDSQIIVLQTCDISNEGEYIIVVGKKINTMSN